MKVLIARSATLRQCMSVGHKLEIAAPLFGDGKILGGSDLVVKHLDVDGVAPELEAMHDAVVGYDTVAVVLGLEGFYEDHVAVGVVCQNDVVVAAARADGESAHVVGVELANGLNDDEEFFGALGWELPGDVGEGDLSGRFGLGGAGVFLRLDHVASECFNRDRAVFGGVGVGQARPRAKVAGLGGCQSRGANGESSAGGEVFDERCHDGEVVGVESRWPRCHVCRQLDADLGVDKESTKLGNNLLVPVTEEDVVVLGKDRDRFFLKEGKALMVTKRSNSHQIVVEAGHGVSRDEWQLGERPL